MDARLPEVLAGKHRLGSGLAYVAHARLCTLKKHHAAAAALYAAGLALEPALVAHRYNATCAAALAGRNQGDEALTFSQKMRWRRQALTWLHADLAQWIRLVERGEVGPRRLKRALTHWQTDPDLGGLRDALALKKLSAEERDACVRLWADVAALLKRTESTK
jgi:hypothetical protein